jgi:hypothetical protein
MPDKGWQEVDWIETKTTSWLSFSKNDEKDRAIIWVGSEEGNLYRSYDRLRIIR